MIQPDAAMPHRDSLKRTSLRHRLRRCTLIAIPFLVLGAIINVAVCWRLVFLPRADIVVHSHEYRLLRPDELPDQFGPPSWPGGVEYVSISYVSTRAPGRWRSFAMSRCGLGEIPGEPPYRSQGSKQPTQEYDPLPEWSHKWIDLNATPKRWPLDCWYWEHEWHAYGWPAPAMIVSRPGWRVLPWLDPADRIWLQTLLGGYEVDRPRMRTLFIPTFEWDYKLPLVPLWPGFLINSTLYALPLAIAFFLPLFGFRRLRGTFRRRRGQCAHCGYSLAGLATATAANGTPSRTCPECGHATPNPASP